MRARWFLLSFLQLLLLPQAAFAATYTLCVDIETDYDDYGGSTWWTTNADRPARGVWIVVYDETAFTFSSGYADNNGCRTATVVVGNTTHVWVNADAQVNGIQMKAYPPSAPGIDSLYIRVGWVPTGSLSESTVIPYERTWGALAIGMWAMDKSKMGISATLPLVFRTDTGACCSAGSELQVDTDSKKIITHEIGHAVGYRRDEDNNTQHDYGASRVDCFGGTINGSHSLHEKEFQSAAAAEGWADFYAAWAWNTQTSNTCTLDFQGEYDFDLDGTLDTRVPGEEGWANCESSAFSQSDPNAPDDGRDWLKDLILYDDDNVDGLQCAGTWTNRGTEYDWMRFFWDLHTDQALNGTEIASLYDEMNPKNWDSNGGTVTTTDDPVARLNSSAATLDAALGLGITKFRDAVAAQDDNGQDH